MNILLTLTKRLHCDIAIDITDTLRGHRAAREIVIYNLFEM